MSIRGLVTIIPNDKCHGQRSSMIMTKTLFFKYFWLDQLQPWCASSIWSTTSLISFGGRSAVIFMVSAEVKNCVPRGLKKTYILVPHMKALDECFSNQLTFWCYDVIGWRNDVKSFFFYTKCTCSTPESMHTRMGDLNQCMPEWGRAFARYSSPYGRHG
jgi:hypothetical protein